MISKNQTKNLRKHFSKYATTYKLFKREMNQYKEWSGDIYVSDIKGIFFSSNAKVNGKNAYKLDEAGVVTEMKTYKLQVMDLGDITNHMYVHISNKKYEIIDIEDEAGLEVSWILKLKEADINDKGQPR